MDFLNSSDGIINGALTKAWQITLTSTNGALKFVNFDPGDLLTLVVKEDASGSNYTLTFPSSVKWQAGSAPGRDTTANAVSVLTFAYDGTNWRDTGSSSKGLPARIASAALGLVVGAGVVALTLVSSGGNGQRPGPAALPDIIQYATGSGSSKVTVSKVNASGSYIGGSSGALAVGSVDLTLANAKFLAKPNGQVIAKNNISGGLLRVTSIGAGSGSLVLTGSRGAWICGQDRTGGTFTQCYFQSGAQTCTTVPSCP